MEVPIVQIQLDQRVQQVIPLRGACLRIGRLKDNDIVLNHLAVSRSHAALHRVGEGVELEDLGSENGCYVNGARVRGRMAVAPGDEIRVGKHTLVWHLDDSAESSGPASPGVSAGSAGADGAAVDAAEDEGSEARASAPTGPPVETKSPQREGAFPTLASDVAAELDLEAEAADWMTAAPDSEIDPIAEGLDLEPAVTALEQPLAAPYPAPLDEAPLVACDEEAEALEISRRESSEAPPSRGLAPEESLFDFSNDADLAASDPAWGSSPRDAGLASGPPQPPYDTPTVVEEEARPELTAGRYPGLILQRGERLERVVAWQETCLAAALGEDGQLRLGPEAAPAQAFFAREGERFCVRSEGGHPVSINDEPVDGGPLEVGDVVALGEWRLTFVLDHEPIHSEVLMAPPPSSVDAAREARPVGSDEPAEGESPTVEMSMPTAGGSRTELDLLTELEEEEQEKELSVPAFATSARAEGDASSMPMAPLRIELEIQPAELPAPLRALVDALGDGEVSVPVRLRLRSGGGAS